MPPYQYIDTMRKSEEKRSDVGEARNRALPRAKAVHETRRLFATNRERVLIVERKSVCSIQSSAVGDENMAA